MKTTKTNIMFTVFLAFIFAGMVSCDKEEFAEMQINPNVPSKEQIIPPSQLLNRCLFEIFNGGGVLESEPGATSEQAFNNVGKWCQYIVSNDAYYGGTNTYDWSNSATMYSVLRNVIEMENGQIQITKRSLK